ncbi:glycosyltransferase [Roseateles cellulosilyticus]|uniref:Glycosyltransferase n=1 Tax=Pelomonas cellulosilytica TaxID=2906762 RepID=A0ABS8Y231_9BURK|nr:glycosyltransferase [Pelomonas sp. P8]MCE4558095.1 glycosyltransferase [Pelomonas sp. P8]
MKILIAAAGSLGDTLPFVALGRALQHRGHDVQLFGSESYAGHAAGLPFTPVLSAADSDALLRDPRVTDPRRGMALIAEIFAATLPEAFEAMRAAVIPGQTLAVGSTLAFSTRLLKDALGVPTATVHLAPSVFRSVHAPPQLGPRDVLGSLPASLQRAAWWLVDRLVLDRLFARPFNAYRRQLGLAPVDRLFGAWLHQADLTLGMFPHWFAPPLPDWPAGLVCTGFPLYDGCDVYPLPPALAAFLDAGEPPVGFTSGTANATSHDFFAASAAACALGGRRGLLITKIGAQLPARLPPGVLHVPYAPFSQLLPRLAAFVHHGGIGTTSQALRAGVPQLVRPMAYDQFDNAHQVQRLGVGNRLLTGDYEPAAVARALDRLTADPALQARCAEVAVWCREDGRAVSAARDAVLALSLRISCC